MPGMYPAYIVLERGWNSDYYASGRARGVHKPEANYVKSPTSA
jgi:hypothetical protein